MKTNMTLQYTDGVIDIDKMTSKLGEEPEKKIECSRCGVEDYEYLMSWESLCEACHGDMHK